MDSMGFVERVAEAVLRRTRERRLLDHIAGAVSERIRQRGATAQPSADDMRRYVLEHFGHLAEAKGPTSTSKGAV